MKQPFNTKRYGQLLISILPSLAVFLIYIYNENIFPRHDQSYDLLDARELYLQAKNDGFFKYLIEIFTEPSYRPTLFTPLLSALFFLTDGNFLLTHALFRISCITLFSIFTYLSLYEYNLKGSLLILATVCITLMPWSFNVFLETSSSTLALSFFPALLLFYKKVQRKGTHTNSFFLFVFYTICTLIRPIEILLVSTPFLFKTIFKNLNLKTLLPLVVIAGSSAYFYFSFSYSVYTAAILISLLIATNLLRDIKGTPLPVVCFLSIYIWYSPHTKKLFDWVYSGNLSYIPSLDHNYSFEALLTIASYFFDTYTLFYFFLVLLLMNYHKESLKFLFIKSTYFTALCLSITVTAFSQNRDFKLYLLPGYLTYFILFTGMHQKKTKAKHIFLCLLAIFTLTKSSLSIFTSLHNDNLPIDTRYIQLQQQEDPIIRVYSQLAHFPTDEICIIDNHNPKSPSARKFTIDANLLSLISSHFNNNTFFHEINANNLNIDYLMDPNKTYKKVLLPACGYIFLSSVKKYSRKTSHILYDVASLILTYKEANRLKDIDLKEVKNVNYQVKKQHHTGLLLKSKNDKY